jgi:hypothetical protein
MTAREALAREWRQVLWRLCAWCAAFPACWLLSAALALPVLFYAGVTASVAGLVGLNYAQVARLPCPWCGGRLGSLLLQLGGQSAAEGLHYCPYCGADLDGDVADAGHGAAHGRPSQE